MQNDTVSRLQTSWSKGQNYFSSFFQLLEEVQNEIGSQALPGWCRSQLEISYEFIVQARKLLPKEDSDRVGAMLSPALKLEKRQREDEELVHELERARKEKELAETRREIARVNAETKQIESPLPTKPKRHHKLNGHVPENLKELLEQFKEAEKLCITDKIQGGLQRIRIHDSIHKAGGRMYSHYFKESGIELSEKERRLLVVLGRLNEEEQRKYLVKNA